jgi:hypothetical protein
VLLGGSKWFPRETPNSLMELGEKKEKEIMKMVVFDPFSL